MIQFEPDRPIQNCERMRLLLSNHTARNDMKSRWKDIQPEDRKVLREEWGNYINCSEINNEDMCFLDYWKSWL